LGPGKDYSAKEEVVAGNIVTLLRSAWDTLRPHLATTRFQDGALFQETLLYPDAACLEALVNAIAHRDYSIEGRGIEVFVFDDRMEVRSPGSLVSTLTVDQLKSLRGAHQSRNPYVAGSLVNSDT
jgi:ATP-dependent DNA helicase RecG